MPKPKNMKACHIIKQHRPPAKLRAKMGTQSTTSSSVVAQIERYSYIGKILGFNGLLTYHVESAVRQRAETKRHKTQ
jgi:hypothetical protein